MHKSHLDHFLKKLGGSKNKQLVGMFKHALKHVLVKLHQFHSIPQETQAETPWN